MKDRRNAKPELGDEPPLVADRRRRPDRRQVSARWLAGTLLTGLTSTALMGIALSAAHDGRTFLASPAAPFLAAALGEGAGPVLKGERVFATPIPITKSRRTIEVSAVSVEGDREVIRTVPFAYASMLLGARQPAAGDYPPFDPLAVYMEGDEESEDGPERPSGPGIGTEEIYDARVEPDVELSMEPFTFASATLDDVADLGTEAAEKLVRGTVGTSESLPVQVATYQAVDPSRFGGAGDFESTLPGLAFRVTRENVSDAPADKAGEGRQRYFEEIVPFREERPIREALLEGGYEENETETASAALAQLLRSDALRAGDVLRIGLSGAGDQERIVRLSAYRGERHVATVGTRRDGRFVQGPEPALSRSVAQAFDENATEPPLRDAMPSVYDGIYQAALAHGLDDRLSRQLIRMLASEVDYQSRLQPTDRLTILYSLESGTQTASRESEILYVQSQFGDTEKRYYRYFSQSEGTADYYDEEGRSARQFLLRSPVPTGRFTSSFGSRRHPVLGYRRMHWGVDWAAPRGTPILSSGAGTVIAAGWSSGYGRQTVIRHANGYETSYSHQNSISVSRGDAVRQGEVIGTVGSTGLSTGNHLHYELSVNGQRVDPMRIRMPSGETLQGDELELFQRERERIDALLLEGTEDLRLAGR